MINYTKKNLNFLFHCIFIILIIVFFFLSFQDDKIFDQIIEKSINKGMTDEKKLTTIIGDHLFYR